MALKNYKDLVVWQKAISLTTAIYRCTEFFPRDERFGLTNQLRRAAVSVPSNIAEGYGRGSRREYRHFPTIARGSNMELQTQLVIAGNLGFGLPEDLSAAASLSEELGWMLNGLIKRLHPTETPDA